MACRLSWSPAARHDLRDLCAYIAEDKPAAARRFVQGVIGSVRRLSDFPDSGRIVPERSEPKIREIIRRPCRIVYRVKSEARVVEIVRVWHAARGVPKV